MAAAKKKKVSGKVLGRGLGNLLEASPETERYKKESGIVDIDVSLVRVNPDNPRKKFNKSAIESLAQTIKKHGLLQPILVEAVEDSYRVISGERRLRAFRQLKEKKIPAIIKKISPDQTLEVALIENIQREQLDTIEEAMAYKLILDRGDLTQEDLATQVGKNRATIANRVRLLGLPLEIQALIADNRLSEGQARPLLSVKNAGIQSRMAMKITKENLSARDAEELVRRQNAPALKKSVKKPTGVSAEIKDLEKRLESRMKTRVKVSYDPRKKKGKINVEYFSLEELDRILRIFGAKR